MFITQGIKPHNEFWKYLLGSAFVIFATIIGQLPLLGVVAYYAMEKGGTIPADMEGMAALMDSNLFLFLMLLSFPFALAGLYFFVRIFHRRPFRELTTARPKTDWKRILFAFFLWGSITVLTTIVAYEMTPEDFQWNFKPEKFAILAVIGLIMIPIQTSTEEYIFRGYLMQGFAGLFRNRWAPLLLTSLIFGSLHLGNPEVEKVGYIILFYYIGTGLFLGIVTLMDDGMELSLGFHAANNLVTALLVTSDWTAFQTDSILLDKSEPTAGFEVFFPLLIIFPILLIIFSKKYKWSGWKEKLTGKILIPDA